MVLILLAYIACLAVAIVWVQSLTEQPQKVTADLKQEERSRKARKKSAKHEAHVVAPPAAVQASTATNGSTAPVRNTVKRVHPDRLSCAPFANEDMQKLVFGYVGGAQWLVMGAVCAQWQHMYKQQVKSHRKPRQICRINYRLKEHKREVIVASGQHNETAYFALFASVSRLQMGVESRLLCLKDSDVQYNAGKYGSEASLFAAHKRGLPWTAAVLKGVAASGSLSKMQWLLTRHFVTLPADIADSAAEAGDVDMLKLLKQHKAAFKAETSLRAVKPGQLHVLKYLHSEGCPTHWEAAIAAADCGALGIIKFLQSMQDNFDYEEALCSASSAGHLKVVVWLVEQGVQLDSWALHSAAIYGQLEVCKYLYSSGFQWTARVTDDTIACSPQLMPWVLSQGIVLTAEQRARLAQRTI